MDDFERARINMVKNQIMPNRVFDQRILKAMSIVPRHLFLTFNQEVAYLDRSHLLHENRYMLQPDVFARMLEACNLKDKDHVLDVACGTGYSTVVIANIVDNVIGVDCIQPLTIQAAELVVKLGYQNITIKLANLFELNNQDFDVIIINGAVHNVNLSLFSQLKDQGRLIAVECIGGIMKVVKYLNHNGQLDRLELFDVKVDYL